MLIAGMEIDAVAAEDSVGTGLVPFVAVALPDPLPVADCDAVGEPVALLLPVAEPEVVGEPDPRPLRDAVEHKEIVGVVDEEADGDAESVVLGVELSDASIGVAGAVTEEVGDALEDVVRLAPPLLDADCVTVTTPETEIGGLNVWDKLGAAVKEMVPGSVAVRAGVTVGTGLVYTVADATAEPLPVAVAEDTAEAEDALLADAIVVRDASGEREIDDESVGDSLGVAVNDKMAFVAVEIVVLLMVVVADRLDEAEGALLAVASAVEDVSGRRVINDVTVGDPLGVAVNDTMAFVAV